MSHERQSIFGGKLRHGLYFSSNLATWMFMGVLMLMVIFGPRQEADQAEPFHELVDRIMQDHPDPAITMNLRELWEEQGIVIGVADLHSGVLSMFSLQSAEFVRDAYGFLPERDPFPVIFLDRMALQSARGDLRAERVLMSSFRHEYEHYRQWRMGGYYPLRRSVDVEVVCAEIWEREFTVFRDDCYRAEVWWPEEDVLRMCDEVGDPKRFADSLIRILSRHEPDCASIWRGMTASL